ncbi:MAG: MlaE family lipid ABC transporter permease subunit [Chitinispirillaceae bacterium]|nr:MlaE family lipid ABC transporter permease subunit [Chitinispirillaceae bacterium]
MNGREQRRRLSEGQPVTVRMPVELDRRWVEKEGAAYFRPSAETLFDFLKTEKIDSAGLGFIRSLDSLYKQAGKKLVITNITQDHLTALTAWSVPDPSAGKKEKKNLFIGTADTFLALYRQSVEALSVLVEMLFWGTIGVLKKQDFKRGALGEQMYQLGFKAVGIVGLLSFLIGIVLALQTAMQLRTYGAGIFLAPLIGITMVREMGPLLTAIILAGRTGSATTAEIATMGVSEEIDALKTMGINPVQFVVVPKFWAITLTMPLLSIIATAAGIFGGYCVAIVYLDLAPSLFFSELSKHIGFDDFWAGFVKSVVFSWLIVWIGSFYGLRVHGGAEAVGKETTESVVTGIFIIIIADAIFSFLL